MSSSSAVGLGAGSSNVVPLKYVARAGLLPELTRQTYDSLYKALREVILNSVDAGATRVIVDLSAVGDSRVLEITDDGGGMTLDELQQSFMSLGGSQKFGEPGKFGRIGIGSLALMHYAQSVEIETSKSGSRSVTKALISHPWALDQKQRTQGLDDFLAGEAWHERGSAQASSHYTTLRLHEVDDVLVGECADISSYYRLIDRLRRILPLRWEETMLSEQLKEASPDLVELIRAHTDEFSANVIVRSKWSGDEPLTKRVYGGGGAREEEWNGTPRPIAEDIVVDDASGSRVIRVIGYLLSQTRPSVAWSGLTVRVQNVAVEERSFFDLESDPGFRKYITGEVWLLDADRSRLINIDRTSFNREASDYRAVARTMQSAIARFKADFVQTPQRAKVAIKRRLDQQAALMETARRLSVAVDAMPVNGESARLPSSNNGRLRVSQERGLLDDLDALGAIVVVDPSGAPARHPYRLAVANDGRRVLVHVCAELVHPALTVSGAAYTLRAVEARPTDPPVLIKNRPREVVFNLRHAVFSGQIRPAALEMVLALELAYVLCAERDDDAMYDRVLAFLATHEPLTKSR